MVQCSTVQYNKANTAVQCRTGGDASNSLSAVTHLSLPMTRGSEVRVLLLASGKAVGVASAHTAATPSLPQGGVQRRGGNDGEGGGGGEGGQ